MNTTYHDEKRPLSILPEGSDWQVLFKEEHSGCGNIAGRKKPSSIGPHGLTWYSCLWHQGILCGKYLISKAAITSVPFQKAVFLDPYECQDYGMDIRKEYLKPEMSAAGWKGNQS
ncbi:hypothetical protein AAES_109804 [Amazona aestiva]|uniref:Uncharacterized protein n=1 Tax=Amazona aestiva TaxID=12930 RepID=A0A0Q3TEF0_AMAAE|nr:hypothetical protein AAES_109804 [Amazona aestiva]